MGKILELYSKIHDKSFTPNARFIDEIFKDEIYKAAAPQLTVVDLGAYEGEFGYYCLPFAKKIYAVEPDPRPFSILDSMVKEFQLQESISCHQEIITNYTGKRWLHASGYGGSSVMTVNGEGENNIELPCLTLNDFLKRNKIDRVDILKVDIESSEAEIFSCEDFKEAAPKIGFIIGEDHGYKGLLKQQLSLYGFDVQFENGLFLARK